MQPREPGLRNMRMGMYEDARIQGGIGAATAFGRQPRSGWLPAKHRRRVLGSSSQFRFPLDEDLSSRGRWGLGGTRSQRTSTEADPSTRASSAGMVQALAQEFRLPDRTVDRRTDGPGHLSEVADQVSSALSEPVACRAAGYAAEAAFPRTSARRRRSAAVAARGLAADKKSAARQRAHLVLIDESGFLLSPLVRRTLAPRGQTPILKTWGGHRDRVSATAALTISPRRRHLGLYFCTYPKDFVNQERSADFLRALLGRLRGSVIVVWDGGPMHHGEAIRAVLRDFPRLSLEKLPPYTPELNPVEYLWNHLKYGALPNFVPNDVLHLNGVLKQRLRRARQSAPRLRSFFKQSGLPIRFHYG
jgi:transposase